MIQLVDKSLCCGCTACASVCPKQCITMQEDEEGFLYPVVNASLCIDCNLCQKVCPELHHMNVRMPLHVYAAKHKDEQVRLASSSGGIFTLLAEKIIDEGGVVFGARFDARWEVVHDYTETKEGLAVFRGSKYVQSRLEDCYYKVKSFLQQDRKVMFTGTPCQIAGLKNYLRKDDDNLLTVDVVCHGVPSPKIWRMYLNEIIARKSKKNSVLSHHSNGKVKIQSIDFRSKSSGWKKFSFVLTLSEAVADGKQNTVLLSSVFYENPYMQAFLSDLSLRPSCYACPVKAGKSGSDITIADFWGIEDVLPEFDDDRGVSLIVDFSGKGKYWLGQLNCEYVSTNYEVAQRKNPNIMIPVEMPTYRDFFFYQFKCKHSVERAWKNCSSAFLCKRVRRFIYKQIGI